MRLLMQSFRRDPISTSNHNKWPESNFRKSPRPVGVFQHRAHRIIFIAYYNDSIHCTEMQIPKHVTAGNRRHQKLFWAVAG